jgi:tetratricopeptide (TPR) repeat protein
MSSSQMSTFEDAHPYFAKTLNNKVWELLQKTNRSKEEDELMIHAAHASLYHWLSAGTGLNRQRGEWLIAHVYTVLGYPDSALRHATRCLELTKEYADLMKDFDRAYAQECMARAYALAGKGDEAKRYIALAEKEAQTIARGEDKFIFMNDFNGGKWYGVK